MYSPTPTPYTELKMYKDKHNSTRIGSTYQEKIPHAALPIQSDYRKEMFFIHCHVPKTGGTTFNTVLEKNFSSSYDPFQSRFIHLFPKVTAAQFEKYINIHDSISAVSSHQFTTVLPYRSTAKNIIAIAFIRDPVGQLFSKYFHQRRFGMKCPERDLLLHDYIRYKAKNNSSLNYTTFLTQMTPDAGIAYMQDLISHENLFLFPLEQFDSALEVLQSKFPNHFPDIAYDRKNISPKDQEITKETKDMASKLIPKENYIIHQLAMDCLTQHIDKAHRDLTCTHV